MVASILTGRFFALLLGTSILVIIFALWYLIHGETLLDERMRSASVISAVVLAVLCPAVLAYKVCSALIHVANVLRNAKELTASVEVDSEADGGVTESGDGDKGAPPPVEKGDDFSCIRDGTPQGHSPEPPASAEGGSVTPPAEQHGAAGGAEAPLKLVGSLYVTPPLAGRRPPQQAQRGARRGQRGAARSGAAAAGLRQRALSGDAPADGEHRRLQAEGLDAVQRSLTKVDTEMRGEDQAFRLHLRHLQDHQDIAAVLSQYLDGCDRDRAHLELVMPELTPQWFAGGGSFEQIYDWFQQAKGVLPRFLNTCEQQLRSRGLFAQPAVPRAALLNAGRWRALMLDDIMDGLIADFRRRAPSALLIFSPEADVAGRWERLPERRNGHPRWERSDLRLFSDRHGLWMIGCAAEEEAEKGFVVSRFAHGGTAPNEMQLWQTFVDGQWRDDTDIRVELPADVAPSSLDAIRAESVTSFSRSRPQRGPQRATRGAQPLPGVQRP